MNFELDLKEIENLNADDFEVVNNAELSEADEKAIMGASCTTCVCTCSCCSV